MSTYRISQLASHAGIPATTLRFYEREGLLRAARTASGYRQYTESDRERVQFIAAAKHLGLPLDQIRELLTVWAGGMCREVRDELRPRVSAQVAVADERIAALQVFRDRLSTALKHLHDLPAKDGPCDPACSFLHDLPIGSPATASTWQGAARSDATDAEKVTVIACSLDGSAYRDRVAEWGRLLAGADIRALPHGGQAARLPADRAGEVAGLVVAEQRCCPFLSFRIDFAGDHVELVVHAPDGAEALAAALFGRDAREGEGCPC